jgi:hypothetical protein
MNEACVDRNHLEANWRDAKSAKVWSRNDCLCGNAACKVAQEYECGIGRNHGLGSSLNRPSVQLSDRIKRGLQRAQYTLQASNSNHRGLYQWLELRPSYQME